MNPQYETINLSEPFLSDHEKKKEKESFYDFFDKTSSEYQSFENIPNKSNNNIFKSFSDENKHTINSEKSVNTSTKKHKLSHNILEKKKIPLPLRSINDCEANSKGSNISAHPDILTKTILEKFGDNFEDPSIKKSHKRSSILEDNSQSLSVVWMEAPRLDLTNRIINLIAQSWFFRYLYLLLTMTNIAFRVFLMIYFYEVYERGFEMGALYLSFFYVPRICYMLSMLKILFHVDVEEVYVERISVGFNSFDDGPVKSWNDQLSYDYEINMNDFFGRKKNLFKKWRKKPMIIQYKETIKSFLKRILLVLIPVETTIVFFRCFYRGKQQCFLKLFLVANWIYQCYECIMLIPCIYCLYYVEYKFNQFWIVGENYDSLSFLIIIWEVFQFLSLSLVLTVFNWRSVEVGPFHFHNFF